MVTLAVRPTGREKSFSIDEIIVSKTDLKGIITYANRLFISMSGFSERELLGQPHSIIRHPDMPRGVFSLLWERIQAGHEVFAAVLNKSKNGDHYWVLAHVTPTFDKVGEIVGYHSSRRYLADRVRKQIVPIYAKMLNVERAESNVRRAAELSRACLTNVLKEAGVSYDQFIFSLLKEVQ